MKKYRTEHVEGKHSPERERVLVTAVGSFAADIVIATLKNSGYYAMGSDIYPKEWIATSKNVEIFYQAPYVKDEGKYLKFIENLIEKHNLKYIFPLIDPQVDFLSREKQRLKSLGATVCVSDVETVSLVRDKYKLPQFLLANDFEHVIPTKLMSEVPHIKEKVFIKPILGRSSEGTREVANDREYQYLKKELDTQSYIVQPLIVGRVITVDVVRDPTTQSVVCIPRRELLRTTSGAGTTIEIFECQTLTDYCTFIVNKLNIIGNVNIEFFETAPGNYQLIEINPRFSGGVKFSHLAGYNVVENHLNCFKNKPIDVELNIQSLTIARKYEEYITEVL